MSAPGNESSAFDQAEFRARLIRSKHPGAHQFDDVAGALHQLRVTGEYTSLQVQVVLKAHAHIAAEDHSLGCERHLVTSQGERRPVGAGGQLVDT